MLPICPELTLSNDLTFPKGNLNFCCTNVMICSNVNVLQRLQLSLTLHRWRSEAARQDGRRQLNRGAMADRRLSSCDERLRERCDEIPTSDSLTESCSLLLDHPFKKILQL
jgi:hypothetical protein